MEIKVNLNHSSYDITIGKSLIPFISSKINLNRKVLILSDDLIPNEYINILSKQCKTFFIFLIKHGESSKSFENFLLIQKTLLDNNFSRSDLLIALGGGVVGDLGGFVASTFKRGIDFVNIPTSTLAMADSSVGGKTAVNFEGYKNMIGTFYQPLHVFIDINMLSSLDKRNYYAGLVEALKCALLSDNDFLNLFEDIDNNILEILSRSIKFKAKIVESDEKELNLRKILNFGHTVAHALESISDYKVLHGEAVAIGILLMIENDNLKKKVKNILINQLHQNLNYKFDNKLLEIIIKDKKSNGDKIDIILLHEVGNYQIINISINEVINYLRREI